jgi:hypothetical protein
LDVTAAASGLDANAAIEAENCEPFSSSCTRLLFGVEELKKVSQLVVISETAADEPPDVAGEAAVDEAAADEAVAGADVAVVDEDELEPPLEQADMAATSRRPSAGAR